MRPFERFRTVKVTTYGNVARLSGLAGQARLVGYALSALRDGTALPWHRVINAQGRLSLERVGSSSGLTQRVRLEREGVKVDAGGRVSLARFGWRLRKRRRRDRALLEHSEVAEQPPQQNENEDGAETAAAHFFRSVSRGEAAKQFAHRLR